MPRPDRSRLLVRAVLASLLLVFAVAVGASAADLSFPPLTGRVVDDAGILSDNAKTRLTAMSQALEDKTKNQLVVATLKSLQGQTIEQYGYQLGRHWGIGQKGANNGVLLIVVPSTHDVRIEVGYGLEGTLTDAQSSLIIRNVMLPDFRRGDYDTGVLAGSATILQLFGVQTKDVENLLAQQAQVDQNDDGNDSGSHGGGLGVIIAIIVIWLVFGRFLWPLLFLGGGMGGGGRWGGGGFGGGGFGGGGFGGGGFGGGGFSGGGGSFGGGGASGHW